MGVQYSIELVSMKITDISVSVHLGNEPHHQISANFEAKVCEPSDSNDPTVMLSIDGKLNDESEQIKIICSVEAVLRLDPIPENWVEVIRENYKVCVQDVIIDKVQSILTDMGFNFLIS